MADGQNDFDDIDFAGALGAASTQLTLNKGPGGAFQPVYLNGTQNQTRPAQTIRPPPRPTAAFKPHRQARPPLEVVKQTRANIKAQALVQAQSQVKQPAPVIQDEAAPIDFDDFDDDELEEVYDAAEPANAALIALSQAQVDQEPSLSQYQRWKQDQKPAQQDVATASQTRALPTHIRPPHVVREQPQVDAQRSPVTVPVYGGSQMRAAQDSEAHVIEEKLKAALSREVTTDGEITKLYTELKEARTAAQTRAGEIAIIRANQAKKEQDIERRFAALQQQAQAETSQLQAQMETAAIERRQYAEENRFLNDELRKQSHQVQILQQSVGAGKAVQNVQAPSNQITRKVNGSQRFRDGFDNEPRAPALKKSETLSPNALKRKRVLPEKAEIPRLELQSASQAVATTVKVVQSDRENLKREAQTMLAREHARYQSVSNVLGHRPQGSGVRAMEQLGKFALPSKKETSFLSIVLERLPSLTSGQAGEDQAIVGLFQVYIELFQMAVAEEYYAPIRLLTSIVRRCLSEQPLLLVKYCCKKLVRLIEYVVKENSVPRLKPPYPTGDPHADLDVPDLLSLLGLIVQISLPRPELLQQLWSTLTLEVTLALLNARQPVDYVLQWVPLLRSSFLQETFGPISGKFPPPQADAQVHVLTYLCHLLKAPPKKWRDGGAINQNEISELQYEVMVLLQEACRSRNGGLALAKHPVVIPRVLVIVSAQLNKMNQMRGEELWCAEMLDIGMRILYNLLTYYEVDRQAKLAAIPGGNHRYLVTMTRIAFSEGLVLEEGIKDDVKDMAHALLEALVTPEDGDELNQLFATQEPTDEGSQ